MLDLGNGFALGVRSIFVHKIDVASFTSGNKFDVASFFWLVKILVEAVVTIQIQIFSKSSTHIVGNRIGNLVLEVLGHS